MVGGSKPYDEKQDIAEGARRMAEYHRKVGIEQEFVETDDRDPLEQYEPDIRRFMEAMRYKLKLNAHKGRWETLGIKQALSRLVDEVEELDEAINKGNMVEIMLEAADVANFALIVAAIAMERGK